MVSVPLFNQTWFILKSAAKIITDIYQKWGKYFTIASEIVDTIICKLHNKVGKG